MAERELPQDFFLRHEPGWVGAFTRKQALGAIENGARIVKANSEAEDATPDGTPGVVLGSFAHPDVQGGVFCYFIEWANRPRVAVGVMGTKFKRANL